MVWAQVLGPLDFRAQDHAEQIARIIRVGDHVKVVIKPGFLHLFKHIAQGAKVFDGKAHAVEQGDLPRIGAPLGLVRR